MTDKQLENLIEQAFATRSDEDYKCFLDYVGGARLFFNVANDRIDSPQDKKILPAEVEGKDFKAVVLYTCGTDLRLNDRCAGIVWEVALEMIRGMDDVDGLVIQSSKNAWVTVTKEAAEELLGSAS